MISTKTFDAWDLGQDRSWRNQLHRWYDPSAGRWISEDPIGFEAGDANLYRYVGNGPTNAVDPSGLEENVSVSLVSQDYSEGMFDVRFRFHVRGDSIESKTTTRRL